MKLVLLSLSTAALALPRPGGPPATLTVDDDGPADFTTVQDAIDAASEGDVILVHPGQYPSFFLDKRLTILGAGEADEQFIAGHTSIHADAFSIASFRFENLRLAGVAERGRVDDVAIELGVLDVEDCASVELSRLDLVADTRIESSSVSITNSTIQGRHGAFGFSCGFSGYDGLHVYDGSFVWIADSTVKGGNGGTGGSPCCDGAGGEGIYAHDGAAVVVRGAASNVLAGGLADIGYCGVPGDAVFAQGASRVTVSGVTISAGLLVADGSSTILTPTTPEPWIRVVGQDGPGAFRRVQLYGEAGLPMVLGASLSGDTLALPGVLEAPLWVSPVALAFLKTVALDGFDSAVTYLVPSGDPALFGLVIGLQGVCPTLASTSVPGTLVVSNPASLVFQP